MPHRLSCRACGTSLTPRAVCNVCNEYICWICSRCNRTEDVTHVHRASIYKDLRTRKKT
jgi:hypothetical protein